MSSSGDHMTALMALTCGCSGQRDLKKRREQEVVVGGDLWGMFGCLSGAIGPPEMKIGS